MKAWLDGLGGLHVEPETAHECMRLEEFADLYERNTDSLGRLFIHTTIEDEEKMLEVQSVDNMTEESMKSYLKTIISKLDDLDNDDFFGTEGWRHFMGFED